MKELKINTSLSYFIVGKIQIVVGKIQICIMAVYIKYTVTPWRISSFVKIVNFVGEPTSERGPPVAVREFIRNNLHASGFNKSILKNNTTLIINILCLSIVKLLRSYQPRPQ